MSDDLTLAEAATRLGRNIEMVRVWLATGRLAGRMRVGRWFVSVRDLERFEKHSPIRRTWSAAAKRRARRRRAERSG